MTSFEYLVFLVLAFIDSGFGFSVYWNVPSSTCRTYGYNFDELNANYGIITNSKDNFRGDDIIILYDPGAFPIILKDKKTNKTVEQNGGVPQNGSIDFHLAEFEKVITTVVPQDFKGLGIIDFEVWRPIFRQNWNDQTLYTNITKDMVQQQYSGMKTNEVRDTAKNIFEKAARKFMEKTLKKAKELRPGATWGYYGFPYCYNYKDGKTKRCPVLAENENNELKWLWEESTGLYPSMYIPSTLTETQYKDLIDGRLDEVQRILKTFQKSTKVYPYVWFKHNNNDDFLPKGHMETALETIKKHKTDGVIIWGASSNVNDQEKCKELYEYVTGTLGPIVQKLATQPNGFVNLPFVPQIPLLIAQRLNKTLRPTLPPRQHPQPMTFPFQFYNYKN